jgi:hypothetical protein
MRPTYPLGSFESDLIYPIFRIGAEYEVRRYSRARVTLEDRLPPWLKGQVRVCQVRFANSAGFPLRSATERRAHGDTSPARTTAHAYDPICPNASRKHWKKLILDALACAVAGHQGGETG